MVKHLQPHQLGNSAGQASVPSQPGRDAARAGTQAQAGISQAGSVSFPQLGGSAGIQSQAVSLSIPQPGRSAGTQSHAGSVSTHAGSVSPPIQEGVQVVQVLFPRQAAITFSPGIVQAM